MVDEVTRLPERSGKQNTAPNDRPAEVFQFPHENKAPVRASVEESASRRTVLLPRYPAFVPTVEAANKKMAGGAGPASDRQKVTARANLHDARFKLEKILADLKKQSDGGSRLIPRIKDVIDGMERDLKVLDE